MDKQCGILRSREMSNMGYVICEHCCGSREKGLGEGHNDVLLPGVGILVGWCRAPRAI